MSVCDGSWMIAVQEHEIVSFGNKVGHGYYNLTAASIHDYCARECSLLKSGLLSVDIPKQRIANFRVFTRAEMPIFERRCLVKTRIYDHTFSKYVFTRTILSWRQIQNLQFCRCSVLSRDICSCVN
jgi:hypothetical protein